MAIIKIDPVTRLEGHLKVTLKVETVSGVPQVVDAWSSGTLFRGLETILVNRPPEDAQHITQRICGVCPVSHGMAAAKTLDKAFGVVIPDNARIMRNLVLGANFLQSHILHFYHLALLDFIDGPEMPPWQPSWSTGKRISKSDATVWVAHYVAALEKRREAHEMGALFGGRLPHPPAYIPGGFTTTPRPDRITKFMEYLSELKTFIEAVYLPDVKSLASAYPEYFSIGDWPGNLLAFGAFDLDSTGENKFIQGGYVPNGSTKVEAVNLSAITEQVAYSWYSNTTNNLMPSSGKTVPQYPKTNAYSWLKAPRYQGAPCEVGPLARMVVNGHYTGGISVMDRHLARAEEALKIANAMVKWVEEIQDRQPVYTPHRPALSATSYGLTEAPRGALGHWLKITNGKISNYQVITPTCWNASPRDKASNHGPIEEALIGTPVQNINEPVEVLRVIHSFDPCLSCAVHVLKPAEGSRIFALGHIHNEEESNSHS